MGDFLTANGFVIPVKYPDFTEDADVRGTIDRGITGNVFSNIVFSGDRFNLKTPNIGPIEARAIRSLFRPALNGHVWNFDGSFFSSKGKPTTTASGTFSATSKFGAQSLQASTTPFLVATVGSDYTIGIWHTDAAATPFTHYILRSDGAQWVDAVRDDSAVLPFVVASNILTLTENNEFYDDVVWLPFVTPDAWPVEWIRSAAFSALPKVRLSGEFAEYDVDVLGDPVSVDVRQKLSGGSATIGGLVNIGLIGGPRIDRPFVLPEFNGLQKLEWTVEDLELDHLDQVASWVDRSSFAVDVVQAVAGNRPIYRIDGTLGATVRFDGVNDDLESVAQGFDMSGGLSVFIVMHRFAPTLDANAGPLSARETGMTRAQHAFECYASISANRFIFATNRSPTPITFWDCTDALIDDSVDPLLWSCRWAASLDPVDDPVKINKVALTTAETSPVAEVADTVDLINIGSGFAGTTLNGEIYAVAMYFGRLMTPTEVGDVEDALNARFGIF